MILLDAYAVIAYLRGERAKEAVRPLLDGAVAVSAANAAEVVDRLMRLHGVDEDEAVLDLMQLDPVILLVDERIALRAGALRARHYHRSTRSVSLADCIAVATVEHSSEVERLATADPHLLDLMHDESVGHVPLPASDGTHWTPSTRKRREG